MSIKSNSMSRFTGILSYLLLFFSIAVGRADLTEISCTMLIVSLFLLSARYVIEIILKISYSKSYICQASIVTIGSVLWFVIALISPYTNKEHTFIIVLEAITLFIMAFFWYRQFRREWNFGTIRNTVIKGLRNNLGVIICMAYSFFLSLSTLKWIPIWDDLLYTEELLATRGFDFTTSNINLLCGHLAYAINFLLFPGVQINAHNPYFFIRICILLYLLIDSALIYFLFVKLLPSLSGFDITVLSLVFLSFTPVIGTQSPNLDYLGMIVLIGMVFFYYYDYNLLFIISAVILCFTKEPIAVLYAGFLLGIILVKIIRKSYDNFKRYVIKIFPYSVPLILWAIIFSIPTVVGMVTGNMQSASMWGMTVVNDTGMYENAEPVDDEQQDDIEKEAGIVQEAETKKSEETGQQSDVEQATEAEKQADTEQQTENEQEMTIDQQVNFEQESIVEEQIDISEKHSEAEIADKEMEVKTIRDVFSQQESSQYNGFYISWSYVESKLEQMFVFHFLWIPLCIMFFLLNIRTIRYLVDLFPIIFGMIFMAIVTCLYHTVDLYRYVIPGSILALIVSVIVISKCIKNRMLRNRIMIILFIIFSIEQYTTIDPLTQLVGDVYSSGNGKVVYISKDNGENVLISPKIQNNRQGYDYENLIEEILRAIDYNEKTLIIIPEMKEKDNFRFIMGNTGRRIWYDTRNNKLITLQDMSEGKTEVLYGNFASNGNVSIWGKDKAELDIDRVFLIAFPFLDNDGYIQGLYLQEPQMLSEKVVKYGTWMAKAIELEGLDLFYFEKQTASEESNE